MSKPRVLVIDDDYGESVALQADFVSRVDPSGRCKFSFCSGQMDGRNSLPKIIETIESGWPPIVSPEYESWALVLLDVGFFQTPPVGTDREWGFEVLAALRDRWSELPVVMLTGEDAPKRAQANLGQADGFLPKPSVADITSEQAFLSRLYSFGLFSDLREGMRLAGSSLVLLKVLQEARRFACDPLGAGRILYGETGTGKTEIARFIHDEMRVLVGRTGEFHSWSAAGANEDITKAALFGHWKGAFTGAENSEPGEIERSHGGTFFLDEVASLTPGAQALFIESRRRDAKLRRLISRMGKFPTRKEADKKQAEESVVPQPWRDHLQPDHRIAIDVVMLTASNVNLHDEEVADGLGFRRDLLNDLGAPIYLPPLNDRREDIPEIFNQIVHQIVTHLGRAAKHVDDRVLSDLQGRDWTKKNVVALRQIAEHAVIAARDFDEILVRHLPPPVDLPNWAGSRPLKRPMTISIPHSDSGSPAPTNHVSQTIADLIQILNDFQPPADLTGALRDLQEAYAALVLRLFGAALRAKRDRRGQTSSLNAVCKLLDVQSLKPPESKSPESYIAYDVVLRIVQLSDKYFKGLKAEKCDLLSDDPDVLERVRQAIEQRRAKKPEKESK